MTTKRTRTKLHSGHPDRRYTVGKGRPPKANRWQPGQSGNPKGRPLGTKNVKAVFQQSLSKKIYVHENGKRCRTTVLEAIILRLISLALKGDHKAIASVLSMDLELPSPVVTEKVPENATVSELSEIYRSLIRQVN